MKKYSILAIVFLFGLTVKAQDIHFTMFNVAPTVLNPACAGVFDGTFRASTNYKSQWGSISKPYKTFSFNVDSRLMKNSRETAFLGAGLNFYRDVAGTTNFGTTKVNLSLSGVINAGGNNTISVGLMAGYGQRSISMNNLEWDTQFTGQAFDSQLPSYENLSFENVSYFDYAAGFLWTYGTAASTLSSFDKYKAEIGGAYHHATNPIISTYSADSEKLHSRMVLHGKMLFAAKSSKLSFSPRLMAAVQGPSMEINVGMMFCYLVQEGSKYTRRNKGFAINAGGYYRVGDAISPSIELEYGSFTVGYSYDVNISGLTRATYGRGGSEFYLKIQNPNPFFRFHNRPSMR